MKMQVYLMEYEEFCAAQMIIVDWGKEIMEYIHRYESPLGTITMASDGEALIGLW